MKHSLSYHLKRIVRRTPTANGKPPLRALLVGTLVIGSIIGLGLSVFVYNSKENQKDLQLEVTFVSPRQAVIFWKTDHPTLGYIRSGETPGTREDKTPQTSSVPGEIHAVVLNDVPHTGLYISIHNESDSIFRWRDPIFIQFDPNTLE